MSSDKRQKKGSHVYFWRACGFLWPYRKMVIASIVCAIFVSGALAGGLGTLLPIMRIFFNGDTFQTWADREITQRRLGVTFAEEVKELRIIKVERGSAAEAGIKPGDVISLAGTASAGTLDALSDPARATIAVQVNNSGATTIALPPIRSYMAAGRQLASQFPPNPIAALACAFGIIACLAVFSNICSYFQEYLSDKAAVLAVNDIRRKLYDHVLHIPLSHFGSKGTSDVTSRLTQDAQNLTEGFKTVLGQSIQEPVKALMALGVSLLASWQLTIFVIFLGPLMLLIVKKFGKKMRRASKRAMVSSANMLGQVEGSLMGIRVVKGASAERFERRKYTRIMDRLVGEQLHMSRLDAFTGPTMGTLNLVVAGSIMLFAAYMVLKPNPSLNKYHFFLVMACLLTIGDSLRRVSKVNNVLQKSNAAAGRILEVLELPVERVKGSGLRVQGSVDRNGQPTVSGNGHPAESARRRIKLPPMQREIRFENISFSYPGAPAPAVIEVSLTVPKGKCIAVVGRNGSGKTTLLALLPRFYEPQEGRILIDEQDIRAVTLRSLRSQISIVTQDTVIFPGTIEQNIAYGNPLATRDEVIAAARRAFAHDFIMDKPQGYDTLLGELGGQLSGGQKQRLCIARAILRKSPILVLDEATSQVDAESEHLIQQAIENVMHERTTFVIAHRFSTILSADEIVVMDRGRIVGQGKHEELLATCETYQQLYERQLFVMPGESTKATVAP